MNILVINSGSSSIKFSIFHAGNAETDPKPLLDGELSGIGTPEARLTVNEGAPAPVKAESPAEATRLILDALATPNIPAIEAVGYRVVHPGPKLDRHQLITEDVLCDLEAAIPFAPLHEPEAIALIRAVMARMPKVPHYACFDTVFHQTMADEFKTYPIPLQYVGKGVRRYGFHGLSCESVVRKMRAALGDALPRRMIIAHLGSGCSVTAVVDGKSVDTTMGLTPTGGVVMGTRPGDLDPGLVLFLLREQGATVDSVERMLNHDAGIKALFGANDMQKLRKAPADDQRARLAIAVFCNSVRRAIGGLAAVHGVDAIIFTGGIGEHDPETRWAVGNQLLGKQPVLDAVANVAKASGMRGISAEGSTVTVYVVPAQEDLMIAVHVARMAASNG